MIQRIYSVFDNKSLVYNLPFYARTDAEAIRLLTETVNDPNSMISRHPGDYVLYNIGSLDDAKGQLIPLDPKHHVIDAVALVRLPAAPLLDGLGVHANQPNGKAL